MTKPTVTTEHLREALATRLAPERGWYMFNEVGAGSGSGRFADVVAVQAYWSRGIKVEAYELKSYRGDWLKELKTPDKAEAIAKHVDRFYVVTGPGVVEPSEVPAGWGHLLCSSPGGRLRQQKAAADLQDNRKQVSLSMFIGILRAAQRQWQKPTNESIEKLRREARGEGYTAGQQSMQRGPDEAAREIARLQKVITDFEAKAKVSIHEYNAGSLGTIVELVNMLDGKYNLLHRAEQAEHHLQSALLEVRKAIQGMQVKT